MNEVNRNESTGNDGHSIARNTIFNLFGRGLPLLVGLGTMPFVVPVLGEARFGLLSIGLAVVSSFFVFDLGLGRAVAKYVAAYRVTDREGEIPSLIWSAVCLQVVLGTLAGLAMAGITPYLVTRFLTVPEALVPEATQVFYLLAATVVLSLTEFSFAGALEGYQRFGAINAVRAPVNVVGLAYIVWVANSGGTLVEFFAFFLASRVLLNALLLICCVGTIPGLFRLGLPATASLRPLIHFGKWVTLSNLVAPALLYADRFLLGSLGSLGQVAFYAAPFQFVERLLIIPGTLTSTLFPAFSALDSAKSNGEIQRLSAHAMHYLLCIMGVMCVTLAAAAPWIVHLFFGPAYIEASVPVFRILLPGFAINAMAFIPFSVVQGCGRPDVTAKFHLIEFPIHLAMVFLGYTFGGLAGVAFAWSLRVTLDCGLLVFYCVRKDWLDTRLSISLGTLRNAIFYGAVGVACSLLPLGAGALYIGLAVAGVLVTFVYTALVGLGVEQRADIVRFLRRKTIVEKGA